MVFFTSQYKKEKKDALAELQELTREYNAAHASIPSKSSRNPSSTPSLSSAASLPRRRATVASLVEAVARFGCLRGRTGGGTRSGSV